MKTLNPYIAAGDDVATNGNLYWRRARGRMNTLKWWAKRAGRAHAMPLIAPLRLEMEYLGVIFPSSSFRKCCDENEKQKKISNHTYSPASRFPFHFRKGNLWINVPRFLVLLCRYFCSLNCPETHVQGSQALFDISPGESGRVDRAYDFKVMLQHWCWMLKMV